MGSQQPADIVNLVNDDKRLVIEVRMCTPVEIHLSFH